MSGENINEIIVASIDFGTTFSGYAYSWRDDYLQDPMKIYANRWDGETLLQAPTVVLFNSDETESYFGFEAEHKYAELIENDEHENWRYFRRFKMDLHRKKKFTREMEISDAQGKTMPAVKVFAAAIGHLINHFKKQAEQRIKFEEHEVRWVITVPAIWNDAAKQVMIEAAQLAGIRKDKLSLAYEPEAAAIYCKQIRLAKLREQGKDATIQPFPPGFKFLVLDLGGGTVDITAHEVHRDGTLQALIEPSGGPWGGTVVDDGFLGIFECLFGTDFMISLNAESKRDLEPEIEIKKKKIVGKRNTKADCFIMFRPPHSMMELRESAQLKSALMSKRFHGKVELKMDKIRIHNSILLSAFEYSVSKIVAHLQVLLRKTELASLNAVVMAGGFSESEVVKEEVKEVIKEFPKIELIVPEHGGLVIVQGAVSYGFNPKIISTRKSRYTYGISTAVPFDNKLHPVVHRMQKRDGSYICEDIFKVFVKKGEEVIPGQTTTSFEFNPSQSAGVNQTIEVYKSEQENPPMLVTECHRVGFLRLTLPTGLTTAMSVTVNMQFGGTQMKVTAGIKGSRDYEPVEASFKWL